MVFLGFIIFLNGWKRSPVILGYFLDDSGNFQNLDFLWTRSGPLHITFITKIYHEIQENMESSLQHIILSYLDVLELRTFLKFGSIEPHWFFF